MFLTKFATKPTLVYLYSAIDQQARGLLHLFEEFEQNHPEIQVTRVDIYKSDGISKRLGITTTPSAVWVKDSKPAGVLTDDISMGTLVGLCK